MWDLKADRKEYPCKYRCFNIPDLRWLVANKSEGMICYSGEEADFDEFCTVAKLFAEKFKKNACLVIDETSDVTNPGKACRAYGNLIRTGLNHGADFYVMCQRGAESDKTAIGNASRLHFSQLGTEQDEKNMYGLCKRMVPLEAIRSLKADHVGLAFEFIDVIRGVSWKKGMFRIVGGKPRFSRLKK